MRGGPNSTSATVRSEIVSLLTGGLVICWLALAGPPSLAEESGEIAEEKPWVAVLQRLEGERDRFAASLADAHAILVARAQAEQPALLARLSLEPPASRATGYGLLPELLPDEAVAESEPRRQRYSLEALAKAYAADTRDTGLLLLRADAGRSEALEPLVSEFERLEKRLKGLENHLGYHDYWQRAVVEHREFFAQKNATLALVEEWRALEDAGGMPEERERLRQEIARRVAPFYPTKGLKLMQDDEGGWILPVRVSTDIEDDEFLGAFREAVHEAFADSTAARSRRFRVEVEFDVVSPSVLYPDGAPPRGTHVDEHDHIGRFPSGSLVLTTGAKSTHAWTGRFIQLGSAPIAKRTLAHEFGHLLGFSDGYLRSYQGRPEDPYGAVIIEWKDLLEGLMGSPSRGRVTAEMIDRLLAAYEPATP